MAPGRRARRMLSSPIKILYLVPQLTDDGPSRGVTWLCKYLDKEYYQTYVCSLSDPKPSSANYLENQCGLHCFSLEVNSVFDIRTLFRISSLINRLRPVIVHTNALRPDWYGRLAAWINRVPVICTTVRNEDDLCYQKEYHYSRIVARLIDRVNRISAKHANAIIAVSKGVLSYLRDRQGISLEKLTLIPNGVDLEQFNPDCTSSAYLRQRYGLPEESYIIGTVAALKQQKGLQYLVAAATQVVSKYPRTKFILIGSGPLEIDLRKWIRSAGLEQSFILAGQCKEIAHYLAGLDIFVFPSLWEGMPRALLEAMAMRRACIATDIGGSREIIDHNKSGILIPPADTTALAQAIIQLLEDRAYCYELGRNARKRIEANYSAKAVALAHDSLYRHLLSARAQRIGGI